MASETLDSYYEQLNADSQIRERYVRDLSAALRSGGVTIDEAQITQMIANAGQEAAQPALSASVPLPEFTAHWWGFRIKISSEFLKWISISGVAVGALVLMLAPLAVLLGPIAAAVVGALAVYLLAQHTALLIQANNCGGFVCLEALWISPVVFVPKCCS